MPKKYGKLKRFKYRSRRRYRGYKKRARKTVLSVTETKRFIYNFAAANVAPSGGALQYLAIWQPSTTIGPGNGVMPIFRLAQNSVAEGMIGEKVYATGFHFKFNIQLATGGLTGVPNSIIPLYMRVMLVTNKRGYSVTECTEVLTTAISTTTGFVTGTTGIYGYLAPNITDGTFPGYYMFKIVKDKWLAHNVTMGVEAGSANIDLKKISPSSWNLRFKKKFRKPLLLNFNHDTSQTATIDALQPRNKQYWLVCIVQSAAAFNYNCNGYGIFTYKDP